MVTIQPLVSEFTICGRLENLTISEDATPPLKGGACAVRHGARVKYLQLSTKTESYSIEVAQEKKRVLSKQLQPGCWLKVTGMRKCQPHRQRVEYIAYRIEMLVQPVSERHTSSQEIAVTKPQVKVLFCQNSTCWKKGGKAACELLRSRLQAKGMADRVAIQTTGCMKQCKQVPNMVIMPGGARYSRVRPQQISTVIEGLL